jgi:hypothetical protein
VSNYLTIAAITSTFSNWLQEKAAVVVTGAKTTIGRPKQGTAEGINIFLYQVTHNPDRRNDDLPTRRGDEATIIRRPQAALDLFYLLTFYGIENDLGPQILLGKTISVLHSQPIITQEMLRAEIARRTGKNKKDVLANFDVSNQVRSITFTPLSYTTEEFLKLWSMLFNIPFTLSLAYKASIALIEADVSPQRALPVNRPDIYTMLFDRPVIDKVISSEGESAPILYDSNLVVTGQKLKGDTTQVRIGELVVTLLSTDTDNTVTGEKITLSLSSPLFGGKALRAGIQGVFILHPLMMGDPKEEHHGFESNASPIVLHPTIDIKPVVDTTLEIAFKPNVGKNQKVLVFLNEYHPVSGKIPDAYTIKAPENNGITVPNQNETDTIKFSVADVKAKTYLLRVQVDGAESLLKISSGLVPEYDSPLVTIP